MVQHDSKTLHRSMKHISLQIGLHVTCYVKSPTAQDVFQPISGLISCTGVNMHNMYMYEQKALCSGGWHSEGWRLQFPELGKVEDSLGVDNELYFMSSCLTTPTLSSSLLQHHKSGNRNEI